MHLVYIYIYIYIYVYVCVCVRVCVCVQRSKYTGWVSLPNGISTFVIFVEQQQYYLIHSWGDKEAHTLPKGINPKVQVIARFELGLVYLEVAVQPLNQIVCIPLNLSWYLLLFKKKIFSLYVWPTK